MSLASEPRLELAIDDDRLTIMMHGDFVIDHIKSIKDRLSEIGTNGPAGLNSITLDAASVTRMDTAGAWAIRDFWHRMHSQGLGVVAHDLNDDQRRLLGLVECYIDKPFEVPEHSSPVIRMLNNIGVGTGHVLAEATHLLSFIGECFLRLLGSLINPRRLRFTSITHHLEQSGLNAIPIVCLMSMLIGVVLAFQGADQLEAFGATIYTVNLLGVSILREIGILITAIIVAGRSGSAFAAQLGSMKVNEEVDALNALGLNTIDVLVLPRMLALMIALPLLAIAADLAGLAGGMLICFAVLDIPTGQFLLQLKSAVSPSLFFVGIGKAPVFAALIALAGCYNGLKVSGSAESVGIFTTRAVVMAIVLVIITNAVFSLVFAEMGL